MSMFSKATLGFFAAGVLLPLTGLQAERYPYITTTLEERAVRVKTDINFTRETYIEGLFALDRTFSLSSRLDCNLQNGRFGDYSFGEMDASGQRTVQKTLSKVDLDYGDDLGEWESEGGVVHTLSKNYQAECKIRGARLVCMWDEPLRYLTKDTPNRLRYPGLDGAVAKVVARLDFATVDVDFVHAFYGETPDEGVFTKVQGWQARPTLGFFSEYGEAYENFYCKQSARGELVWNDVVPYDGRKSQGARPE